MKITETQKSIAQDGLLVVLAMLLLVLFTELLVHPIIKQFGTSGLLVYTLGLLALGMYFLDRTISPIPECQRAWHSRRPADLVFIRLNDQTSHPHQPIRRPDVDLLPGRGGPLAAYPIGVRFFLVHHELGRRMLLQAESILGQFWPVFSRFTISPAILPSSLPSLACSGSSSISPRIMRMWIGNQVWLLSWLHCWSFWQPALTHFSTSISDTAGSPAPQSRASIIPRGLACCPIFRRSCGS